MLADTILNPNWDQHNDRVVTSKNFWRRAGASLVKEGSNTGEKSDEMSIFHKGLWWDTLAFQK